jgi:membrane fusion protein, multidrug efflux system
MAFLQRIRQRRGIGVVVGLVGIAIIAIGVRWLSGHTANSTTVSKAPPSVPVTVAVAVRQNVPNIINTIGTVQSIDAVAIQAQVFGPIVKIEFGPGEDVHKGQELFVIDPRPFQAALDQAKAQLARDQAVLAQAQSDFTRYQTLLKQNSIAAQTAQDEAFVVAQDKAAVALDQANVDTAQINLGYCYIKSPIDGRAGILQVELGNIVGPSTSGAAITPRSGSGAQAPTPSIGTLSTPATAAGTATPAGQSPSSGVLVMISQTKPIYVTFPIAQTLFDEVRKNQAAGALEVDAYSQVGKLIGKGEVTVIDNQVNATTGTVSIQATFSNADDALWPGEFVRVELVVSMRRNAVTIPAEAVMQGPSGAYVYIIGAEDKVQRVGVEVAARRHGIDVIENGIAAGDKVVTDGQYRLANGAKADVTKTTQTSVAQQ